MTVNLRGATEKVVSVSYATVAGTAGATGPLADFIATTGQIVLQPGATTAVVNVGVIGDHRPEPDETFTLSLAEPAAATLGAATATATIVNDDPR
jgi:hypothetical protein